MRIQERLKNIRKVLGLTQEQFALKIGLKKGSYANIESGNDPLVDRTINIITLAFPNVNSDYLISGKGCPLKSGEENGAPAQDPDKRPKSSKIGVAVDAKQVVVGMVEATEVIDVLRELLKAKDQIIADKEKQVHLLETLLQKESDFAI